MRKLPFIVLSLLTVVVLSGCGLDVREPDYLELMNVNPGKGTDGNDPWGPYAFIFDQPIKISSDSMLYASFPAYWTTSGETLFVHRLNGLAGFNRGCTLSVFSLVRNDGEIEAVNYSIDFLTGHGEVEDNGNFRYADTLDLPLLYGELDNFSARTDEDFFVIPSDSTKISNFSLELLNTRPFYFSCSHSSKVYKMVAGKPLNITLTRTLDSVVVIRNYGTEKDSSKISGREIVCRLGSEDPVNFGVKLQPGSRYRFMTK